MEDMDKTQLTPDKTMVAPAVDANATLLGTTVTCPVCKTENAPNEKYCGDCGFLLSSTPGEEVAVVEPAEQPRLIDNRQQTEYVLRAGENTVGRENTDVLLADPTVSRRHALIVMDAGKCWVQDVGSTNGTYVNGQQIHVGETVELPDGGEVKFGSVVLSMKLPIVETEAPAEAEEAAAEEETSETSEVVEVAEAELPEEVVEAEEETPVEARPPARLISADASREHAVVMGTNIIGRRAGNDIVLTDDPYVSGSHAELVADERGFWLTDVGSTNGTTLNGTRIAPDNKMALNDGDEIVFGQTALRFEIVGQTEEAVEEMLEGDDGGESPIGA